MAVNQNFGRVAFGWLDGNTVHMITSANGTEMAMVKRTVRGEKVDVNAPIALKRHNANMQTVDRHDQL